MRIDLHNQAKRTKRDDLLKTRVALLEGFIGQTTDGRVASLLRFAITHLHTAHKNPRKCRPPDPDYQSSWIRAKNDETRKLAVRTYRRWTREEDDAVLSASMPDAEIGVAIGRSLKAVECRRVALKAALRPNVFSATSPEV